MPGESRNDPSSTRQTTFGQQIPKRDSGGFACPSHGLLIPKEGDVQNERPTGSHRLIGSFLVKEKRGIRCFAKAHVVRTYLVLRSSLFENFSQAACSCHLGVCSTPLPQNLLLAVVSSSPSSPRSPPFPSFAVLPLFAALLLFAVSFNPSPNPPPPPNDIISSAV